MSKIIIWLNIFLYAGIVAVGAYDIYRLSFGNFLPTELSAIRVDAIVIRLFFIAPSILCTFGLALRTGWGLRAAISWNFVLAFMLGVTLFLTLAFAAYLGGTSIGSIMPTASFFAPSLLVAIMFLALALALRREAVQKLFGTHA